MNEVRHQYYKGWPNLNGINIVNKGQHQKRYEGTNETSGDVLAAQEFMRLHRNPKIVRSKRIHNRCVNLKMKHNLRVFYRKIGMYK